MTKAEKELKTLKNLAKSVTDRDNKRLYVSDTVSIYIRKKIAELVRKEVEIVLIDKELGVITKEQFEEETSILRLVYKSL